MPYRNGSAMRISQIPNYAIGRIITVIERDEEYGSWEETTAILSSIQRKYDPEGSLVSLIVRLGGNDADTRNGLLFALSAESAEDGSYLYTLSTN